MPRVPSIVLNSSTESERTLGPSKKSRDAPESAPRRHTGRTGDQPKRHDKSHGRPNVEPAAVLGNRQVSRSG